MQGRWKSRWEGPGGHAAPTALGGGTWRGSHSRPQGRCRGRTRLLAFQCPPTPLALVPLGRGCAVVPKDLGNLSSSGPSGPPGLSRLGGMLGPPAGARGRRSSRLRNRCSGSTASSQAEDSGWAGRSPTVGTDAGGRSPVPLTPTELCADMPSPAPGPACRPGVAATQLIV